WIYAELRDSELALQVAEVRLGIDRPADGPLERLRGQELASVPVDVLAQPLAHRTELAARDLPPDIRHVRGEPVPDLDAHDVAERIRGEVAEAAAGPVDVLEDAVGDVGNLDAQVAPHRLVPRVRQRAQVEPAHDLLLELEAKDDVEVVRGL